MLSTTLPVFGSALLLAIMVAAGYTFSVGILAGATERPRLLASARSGLFGTIALVAVAVLTLAYAFVSHDFRLRYVAHYSDRSMPLTYLVTSLWGGQDGSLLWWLFLLSLYMAATMRRFPKKHVQLQPYVIATFSAVAIFFCVLMIFAANPFEVSVAGARPDGDGLNPLLQNFYMAIHPPSLYVGFVGATVPFAFAISALVTGRLDTGWFTAARPITMFSWLFLGIGNLLGMLWAYEELGWGGYWAWDPVENAAFLPWLTTTAFIHSVMIQERRGMLKVWNVFLACLTFFMTIFGTFLTRSGTIASVHSFAQSSIGTYFVYFLGLIAAVSVTLVLYRWPELRDLPPTPKLRKAALFSGWTIIAITAPGIWLLLGNANMGAAGRVLAGSVACGFAAYAGVELVYRRMTKDLKLISKRPRFESLMSREFTFMLNNWGLLSFMLFVLVATTFPMISEALWNEKVTVGPPYYNAWVQPLGILIFAMMGCGTLFGWKKTSKEAFRRAARIPVAAFVTTFVLHLAIGKAIGFPAVVFSPPIYPGALGSILRGFNAVTPLLAVSLAAFNISITIQEFVLLFRARAKTEAKNGERREGSPVVRALLFPVTFVTTLLTMSLSSRRRYGGYLAHLGLAVMILGFTGKSWNVDHETTLSPGQTYQIDDYTLTYVGKRMEVDNAKRMVFADVQVSQKGKDRGVLHPAKFIYKKAPESPTTEVSMMHSIRDDLYLVVGTVNPETGVASLQIHENILVPWIWFGFMILFFGSIVCMWPEAVPEESRSWRMVRGLAGTTGSMIFGVVLATMPMDAHAQMAGTSSLHAGTVQIDDPTEKEIFTGLRCMCGGCARDLLSSCACEWAQSAREKVRARLKAGDAKDAIVLDYAKEYGNSSLAIPPNTGGLRAIYMLPLGLIAVGGVAMFIVVRRWSRTKAAPKGRAGDGGNGASGDGSSKPTQKDEYDARLDEALKDLDG